MQAVARGGISVSSNLGRRQGVSYRIWLQRRNQSSCNGERSKPSSSSSSESGSVSETKPDTPPKPDTTSPTTAFNSNISQQNNNTAPASSAGASIPSVPETTLYRFIKGTAVGRAASWYGHKQNTRPYWTQFWSTVVIYFCGDFAAQIVVPGDDKKVEEGGRSIWERYDPVRAARHLTVGAVACVPVYKWFMFLHNNFNFASKPLSILTKVIVSQCCFTPTFNTYFFTMQSLLAGASLEETWERLTKALPNSIMNSVKLWPGVTAFMFLYIDPQFRAIFSGVISVGWQTYLSWLNQKAAREVRERTAAAVVEKAVVSESPAPAQGALVQT